MFIVFFRRAVLFSFVLFEFILLIFNCYFVFFCGGELFVYKNNCLCSLVFCPLIYSNFSVVIFVFYN